MDIYNLEKSIVEKYNSTNQYLWKLTNDEKQHLKSIFPFTDDIKSQIICLINGVYKQPICETCGKDIIHFVKTRDSVKRFCSNICAVKSDEVRSKMSKSHTNVPSYGRQSLIRLFEYKYSLKGKFIERNLEIEIKILEKYNLGGQWHHHLTEDELYYLNDIFYFVDSFSQKIKCLKQEIFEPPKCVVCFSEIPTKKIGIYKHCNIRCKSKNKEINERISESVCKSIDSDVRVKSGRKWREYILPSGNIVSVQGYEPYALDELLLTYSEDEIIIHPKICIKYKFDGKNRRHKPDLYIPRENRIIEVKSPFTYDDGNEQNMAKKTASIEEGYAYNFMIIEVNNGKTKIKIN